MSNTLAQITPLAVPHKATAGEKIIFKILASLPDDVIVYYDVQIRHRYADFVIISPRLGVLMIEIKDWKANTILSANHDTIELRLHSREKRVTHPVRQARQYALNLKDEIEGRLECRILMDTDGPHKGKISFPIGNVAVLSNISSEEISSSNLNHIFDPARTLTKDQLNGIRDLSGPDLERFLDPYFVPKFKFRPLDQVQIDHLRGIIHPHIVVRSIAQKLTDLHARDPDRFTSILRVLDTKQEQKARNIGPGHRLVFGVAGSGKTSILIARAKYLAEQNPDKRGLILCFNRPLAAYFITQLKEITNLTILTFHQLAFRYGINKDNWDDEFGEKLKATILRRDDRYDYLLIDEAQDFDPDWFSCILALLKNPDAADLFITGDGSQGLYRHRRKIFSWKSEGINAQGRTEYLTENYRNARNIFQLAARFSGASAFGQIEGEQDTAGNYAYRSVTSGGFVSIIRENDQAREVSRVVTLTSEFLSGTWRDEGRVRSINPKLDPPDIGIIYPAHRGREKLISEVLLPQLRDRCNVPAIWISDPQEVNRADFSPAIRIQTIHHAKGLQYRAVIFMWADLLPYPQSSDLSHDRKLFYVALTRAAQFLAILSSGKSVFMEEAIKASGIFRIPSG